MGEQNFFDRYKGLRTLGLAELHEIWKHYDRDNSGYIEAGPELERFLIDILRVSNEDGEVTELEKKDFIEGVLDLFDIDGDGRLDFAEVERLLNES